MTNEFVTLIPQIELDMIEAYLNGGSDAAFDGYFDEHEVPADAIPSQLQIAVARILLKEIQGSLPQWAAVKEDGEVILNRKSIKRHPKATKLTFLPHFVCCINWADSGPGYSWPESYHVIYIPGFEKFVVTASRDGADAQGCADHAIGWGEVSEGALLVAKRLIQADWDHKRKEYDQERWVYLFDEGLVDSETADLWADEVWPSDTSPVDEEDD